MVKLLRPGWEEALGSQVCEDTSLGGDVGYNGLEPGLFYWHKKLKAEQAREMWKCLMFLSCSEKQLKRVQRSGRARRRG